MSEVIDFQAFKDRRQAQERRDERYLERVWDTFWLEAFFRHEDITVDYMDLDD